MLDVMKFFGIKVATFRAEWAEVPEADREQLIAGVKNGSLTY